MCSSRMDHQHGPRNLCHTWRRWHANSNNSCKTGMLGFPGICLIVELTEIARHSQLPAPIRYKEGDVPTEELPYMVWGRALEIKTWIYRPFLFYAIHTPQHAPSRSIALQFVDKALTSSFHLLGKHSIFHRHHGTWYGLRQTVTGALLLLGAVRCGTLNVPAEWRAVVQTGMSRMRFWEDQVPGVSRAFKVVEDYLSLVAQA